MSNEGGKTDSGYSSYSSDSFKKYEEEFSKKFGEAGRWKKHLKEKGKDFELVEKFNYFLGCFVVIRDKLQDELLFGRENMRGLNIKVRKLERDLESRLSMLESQVRRRDAIRSEYEALKEKEKQAADDSFNYLETKQKCYHKKKEKEGIESSVVENAMACKNIPTNIELMKLSIRQSEIALEQGEEILSRIEGAIEEISFVYQKMVLLIEGKKPVLQITDGNSDVNN